MCEKKLCKSLVLLLVQVCLLLQSAAVGSEGFDVGKVDGADIFLIYCAGCHGFDGNAVYEHAPSFSMGDRLAKDDRELLQSVLNGKNGMPPWRDKLPVKDLRNAVAYLRLMHERQRRGEPPLQDELPDTYYLFKPIGEIDMDWVREEVNK